MGVYCPVTFQGISAKDYDALDYRVMGCAYASQNELGRLCDEEVYKSDLKKRLLAAGFRSVRVNVPVTVSYGTFTKTYFLDLVVEDAAIYDLKTATTFVPENDAQLLNYMLLLELSKGKLLNFRPSKVEGRLLATALSLAERRCFQAQSMRWRELSPECQKVQQVLLDLLADWGAFLEIGLYEKALTYFMGSEESIVRRLKVVRDSMYLGTHSFNVYSPGIAFRLTAITDPADDYQSHLRRLLAHTELQAIQWINLKHSQIQFVTLK
jgi:GxxExxY protein